jgi:hypothetical protein
MKNRRCCSHVYQPMHSNFASYPGSSPEAPATWHQAAHLFDNFSIEVFVPVIPNTERAWCSEPWSGSIKSISLRGLAVFGGFSP